MFFTTFTPLSYKSYHQQIKFNSTHNALHQLKRSDEQLAHDSVQAFQLENTRAIIAATERRWV
jgi:hypothetical protein